MPNPLTPSEKQKLQNPYFGCNKYGIQNIRNERANSITIKKILNEFNFQLIVVKIDQEIQKKNNQEIRHEHQEIRQRFQNLDVGIAEFRQQIRQQHQKLDADINEIKQLCHEIRQQNHNQDVRIAEIRQQHQNLDIGIAEIQQQQQEMRQQNHNQDVGIAEIQQQHQNLDVGIAEFRQQIRQQQQKLEADINEIKQLRHEIRQQSQNLDISIAEIQQQNHNQDASIAELNQQSHNQDVGIAEIQQQHQELHAIVDKAQQVVDEIKIEREKAIAEDLEREEQARIQDEKREADLKQWKEEQAAQAAKSAAEIDEKIKKIKEKFELADKERELHMQKLNFDHQARMAAKENLRKQEVQKLQKETSKIEKLQEELARIEIEKSLLIKNTAKLENEVENEILPQNPIEIPNPLDEVAEVIEQENNVFENNLEEMMQIPENAEIVEEVPVEAQEQSPILENFPIEQPLPSMELPQEFILIEAAKTALETKLEKVIKEPLAIMASPQIETKPHFYVVKKPEALEKPKPQPAAESTDQKAQKQNLLRKIVQISLKILSLLKNLFIQWPKALAAYVWQKFEYPLHNLPSKIRLNKKP